jgi:hypothetical protein
MGALLSMRKSSSVVVDPDASNRVVGVTRGEFLRAHLSVALPE